VHCRKTFWEDRPSASARREKMFRILQNARRDYLTRCASQEFDSSIYPNQLCFVLNDGTLVCEKAFVNVLGMANAKGEKQKTWKSTLSNFLHDKENPTKRKKEFSNTEKSSRKYEDAYAYILSVAESDVCDRYQPYCYCFLDYDMVFV